VLSWGALGIGAILVVGSLVEVLRIADRQQQSGFTSSAGLLRGMVVGEVVVVILVVSLLRVIGNRQLTTIAGVVLLVGLIDVIFTAQAGVIP
jgi:hypothetical protein